MRGRLTPQPPLGGAFRALCVGRGACWAVALTLILKDPRPGPQVHRRCSRLPQGACGAGGARPEGKDYCRHLTGWLS